MIASFILSLLAGLLTPYAEPLLESLVRRFGKGEVVLARVDLRVLSFGLMLLIAATIGAFLSTDSSAWLAVAGGLLGYFGRDLYAFARDPHGAAGAEEDEWDGDIAADGQQRSSAAEVAAAPDAATEQGPVPGAAAAAETAEDTLRAVREAVQAEPGDVGSDARESDK